MFISLFVFSSVNIITKPLLCKQNISEDCNDDDLYKDIPSDWWLSPDSKARLLLTCMVHRKNKEIAPLCTGHMRGQNRDAQRKAKQARVIKDREDEHVKRNTRYFNDPRMKRQQRLQEDVARMAIIEKDIEAVGKKAAYVDKMIEIYFKTKDNLIAKFGQEWFDNKIAETVAMLPDGNKSLLNNMREDSVESDDNEGVSTSND